MSTPQSKPSKKRFALLVFLFVYPMVTALLYLISYLAPQADLWQRSLMMVPIIVIAMVYGIIPFIQGKMRHLL